MITDVSRWNEFLINTSITVMPERRARCVGSAVSCPTVCRRTLSFPPPTDGTSLYLYRGAALSEYSPLEYAVCVSVRKKEKEKKNKDSICGPVPSPRLDFDADHPSAEIYTQHLLTRYRIPKVSERPPPAPRRDDTDTSSEKR